ncbi:MAG TPA: erythronate-4-phosphate dehydrogenase [Bacteroidales bacterium]|nr:erythronate-4-phosphate dehydrogenase [Bacteroidales bacterium]
MKIIIDNKIPLLKGLLESWATVEYVHGDMISNKIIRDADAMIIRTRTHCDADLLKGSPVKFIGTASIGTDHIDLDWCLKNGIFIASAPGCNSGSVMQYLCSALLHLSLKNNIEPCKTTIGIIGVGNVGRKVAAIAEIIGFKVLRNDPPRQRAEGSTEFVPLDELLEASDIVSMHVPLTFKGTDKTYHMADNNFFLKMQENSFFINTARGPVMDEKALLKQLQAGKIRAVVIDVWKDEPDINIDLLNAAEIGTSHIAGYSADGKSTCSMMVVRQLAEYFDLPLKDWKPLQLMEPDNPIIDLSRSEGSDLEVLAKAVMQTYNIERDSNLLKNNPDQFEKLRGDYPNRREFHAYKVKGYNKTVLNKLRTLGFR